MLLHDSYAILRCLDNGIPGYTWNSGFGVGFWGDFFLVFFIGKCSSDFGYCDFMIPEAGLLPSRCF
jgi:hypothetical protein